MQRTNTHIRAISTWRCRIRTHRIAISRRVHRPSCYRHRSCKQHALPTRGRLRSKYSLSQHRPISLIQITCMSPRIPRPLIELHPSHRASRSSTELHAQRQRRPISNRKHTRHRTVLIQTTRTARRIRLHRGKRPHSTRRHRPTTNTSSTHRRRIRGALRQCRRRHKHHLPAHRIIRSSTSNRNTSRRLQHQTHTARRHILRQHSRDRRRDPNTASTTSRHLPRRHQR